MLLFALLAVGLAFYRWQTPTAKASGGASVTVAAEGTQVANLQPGTGVYLGGGFTVTTSSSLNLTSVGITVSGTVSTANLSNMAIFEESGTCTNNPSGKTQYAGTSATVSAKTTFTQNLALAVNVPVCLYVVADIGSGVSDGQTLDLSIAANSDVTVSSGGATVSGAPAAISGTGTIAGILTVDQSGTVTSAFTAPTAGQYVGAGFTLNRTNGGANITSIKITKSGTVSDAAITNLKLYYKTESPCAFGGATGATLFNSVGGTFSSGASTVTGTLASGSSQICLYAVVDIGSGAANGSTLGFSINDPATDVAASSGTVTPGTAVALNGSATISTAATITISGTLYDQNETSPLLAADALKLSVAASGSYTTTASAADGTFTFSNVAAPSTGAIITLWMNLDSDQGTLVFRYNSASCNGSGSGNCTNLKLIKNRIALDSFDGGSITNTALAGCDNDSGSACSASDIGFTSNAGVFTATIAGEKLKINSGATYAPGGAVTVPQLDIEGTYSGGTETLTLTGSGSVATCADPSQIPLCVDGAFNAPAVTSFTGSSGPSSIPALTYQALNLTPAGTVTYTLGTGTAQTLTATGTLTIGNGTNAVTVTAAANNPNLTLKGNLSISANAIYTKGSGLTVFQAGTSQILSDNTAGKQDLGAVQISAGSGATTLNLGTSIKATMLTIDTSQIFSVNGANTLTLTGSGAGSSRPLAVNGIFSASTGTVEYTGVSSTEITAAPTYFNLKLDPAATVTYTLGTAAAQTLTATGTLTIGNGTNVLTVDAATYNPALVAGNLTIAANAVYTKGSGTISFTGGTSTLTDRTGAKQDLGAVQVAPVGSANTLLLGSSAKLTSLAINSTQTFNANGANTLTLTGSGPSVLTASGTFTGSTGTVEFIGTGATTIPNIAYANLVLDPAATATYTLAAGSAMQVTNWTIGDGTHALTLDAATNNPGVNILGNFTLNANAIYMKGTGVLTFKKGGIQSITDNSAAKQDLGAIVVAGNGTNTTVNMGSALKVTSLNINLSQTFSANGSNSLVITGSGTGSSRPLTKSGTFTAATGTVEFIGTSATTVDLNGAYNNLIIDPAAVVTYTLGTAAAQTLTVAGDLTLGDGTNAVTVTAATNNPTINLGGNLTISANAIYTKGSGFTNADKGGSQTFTDNTAAKQNLGRVTIVGGSGATALNLGSDLTMDTVSINSSQTLNVGSRTLTLQSNGSNDLVVGNGGVFNAGTGTINFASSGSTGTTIPSVAYYNLIFNSAGNNFTVSTGTLNVSNDLTLVAGTLDLSSNNNRTAVGHDLTIGGTLIAPADTLTVNHDFVNNGTYTADSGTVAISPTGTSQIRGSSGTSFGNLTINAPGKTVQFAAGLTFTITGTLTLAGTSGTNLNIQSTGPGVQWLLNLTGPAVSASYISVKDSGCAVGSHTVSAGLGSQDLGNNGSCWAITNLSYGGGATPAGSGSGGGTPTTGGTQYSGGTTPTGSGSGGGTPTTGGTQHGGGTNVTP